jgi:hypothetical protein
VTCWPAAGAVVAAVAVVAGAAVDAVAAACAPVVAHAAAVIAAAVLGARRRCRDRPLVHRRSIDRPGVQARGPAMVICQPQAVGRALAPATARAAVLLEIVPAALAQERVIVPA